MRQPKLNPDFPDYGTKEYYEWAYKKKGAWHTFTGNYHKIMGKTVAPMDAPADPYDYYFDPVFSNDVEGYVQRDATVYQLLPKTTFQQLGDSFKYWDTDISATVAVEASATPFTTQSNESGPDLQTVEQFEPSYLVTPFKTSMMSEIASSWQNYPPNTMEFVKTYFEQIVPNDYDKMLLEDVDAPGTAATRLESLDRIISDGTESGDGTTYVSVETDGDIYWGKAAAIADRSESSAEWTDAQVDLPDTAAARVLDMGGVDDVLRDCLEYAGNNPRYIMLTGRSTLNEICDWYGDKQWFAEAPMNINYTLNGVETARGGEYGISVASIISNGLQIPIFTDKHVSGENGNNLTTKITDADCGHIYLLNLDDLELRIALPPMYYRTPPEGRLMMDSFYDRHWVIAGMQLLCTNFKTQGAFKYIKAS